MNIYLLQFVGKWISVIFISILSLFVHDLKFAEKEVINDIESKDTSVESIVVPYEVSYRYNASLPYDTQKIVQKGIDGVVYSLEDGDVTVQEMVPEIIEIGIGGQSEYVGMLTGYGPDCVGCSVIGNVACPTREGVKHSLVHDGVYYNDVEYGKVRIVSADHRAFPCGTIIEIENNTLDKVLAVVLDTGAGMRNAYNAGWILIDLAFDTEAGTFGVTNKNTKFTVKRYGW